MLPAAAVLSVPRVAFPSQDALARKFFREAARHLGDALILHDAGRFPGAINSSMKAAELGTKAVLIIHGSLGWWDQLLQTHKPLGEIKNHVILGNLLETLIQHDPVLANEALTLEALAPSRPGRGVFDLATQANTEYPFFYLMPAPAGGAPTAHLDGPGDHFNRHQSEGYYRTAHQLPAAYQVLYPKVRAWRHRLPRPL